MASIQLRAPNAGLLAAMMGTHTRYNDGCSQLQPLLDTCYSLCLLATMMATCTHYSDAGSTGYDDGYWLQQWLVYSLQRCLLAMATGYDYGWSPRCSLLATTMAGLLGTMK